ncbi:MAG TPA: Ig-like domain-containing protein [Terriglobales bacterium]|nr:Ig-like domain-containing protein [Terriglobales bacterium]
MRGSAVTILAAWAAIVAVLFLGGCGSGYNAGNVVSKIILTPTTFSLNEGDVATLSASAQNAGGLAVAADITFSSNSSQIATVSPGGLICAGVWDPSYVFCNATQGKGGVGQVTITATATASNNVSASAIVYVHEKVDRVNVFLNHPCTTMGQTVSLYAQALSTSAPGCSPAAPCDITSTVGPITFGSNDTSIVAVNSAGQLVAGTPGATTVFASVAGVNSLGTHYLTCPVATIQVHGATSSQTSFVLGGGNTASLTADVYDTNSQYIKPTLTWGSSNIAAATVTATGSVNNPGTVTGVAPGTTYITATCSYPNCNKYVPAQYSQNVVTVIVGGNTSTTVYAASTNSTMLVPFSIDSDTPGTAITLPHTPNSIMANPNGSTVYLGSSSGLMAVNVSSGAVTTYPANGAIVAISPDGNYLLLSDSVDGVLNYFNISSGTIASTRSGVTVTSDAYTPDSGFNEWVTGTTFGFGLQTGTSGTASLANPANALDIMAQGGLTYITSASGHEIYVYSTCNQSQQQVLTANNPTLIKALPNGTGAVAADSPNIDVITTPSTVNAGCPVTTQSTLNSYDLGVGNFTAEQMFVSSNNSAVWIVPNLPEILYFYLPGLTPTAIPLAGGATPEASAYDGGVTLDSAHAYFGASDGTVHRIDVPGLQDVAQIAVGLKDSNGNVTPPNLVCVVPQ